MPSTSADFASVLANFAAEVTSKFSLASSFSFNPEDQLKGPIGTLLAGAGDSLGQEIESATEAHAGEVAGRPDVGVAVGKLLTGHIELKAPGKGADPTKLKGADKKQWEKFRDLPNLIYTDGNAWALYRSGQRIGRPIRLSGDVTSDGAASVGPRDADELLEMFRDFLHWEPTVPASPRALAALLAPLCRMLRTDVLTALKDPESNLSVLAEDWRQSLFPDADDKQFADAYAQTLTYALLLARLSGASDLSIPQAAKAIRSGHHLLADV